MNNYLVDSSMLFLFTMMIICCKGQECLDEERTALQKIKESMGYDYEYFSDDCCTWETVHCSSTTSHVIRIFFDDIRKDEDPWLLDMSLFAELKELQELSLPRNHISELINPSAICELVHLEVLDLSVNSIEAEAQPCWANMPSIRTLDLSENQFRGDLASFLANISKMEYLDVSYNLFKGFLQFSMFADLSNLTYIDLSYNYQLEVETESPIWHPSFQIQHLFLAGCSLNRQSGHGIPSFLHAQQNLTSVDLSTNSLEGKFPTWMLHNVSSKLRLRSNSFVGKFPENLPNVNYTLAELDISDNDLEGHLPSNINILFPSLYNFNSSSNRFSGDIPSSFGELKELQLLDLSNNIFSGVVPDSLANSPFWYLNLSNNSLQGKLLPENCNMTYLKWLLLHHNHFEGEMPSCLSNSPFVTLLDVRHNNLSGTISNLPVFRQLAALLLKENQFIGDIPRQLCEMNSLQFVDLSRNKFSGTIPSCLGNNLFWRKRFQSDAWVPVGFTTKGISYLYQGIPLTLMTGIDFSDNELVGAIPYEIGKLVEVRSLNLSYNLLTGNIPKSFKKLTNLESLDLSHNHLTGQIPPELAQIDTLTTFSVAFNNLSGRIPLNAHFETFPESSFGGNENLCDDQLQSECAANHNDDDGRRENPNEKPKDSILDNHLFFYSFVFISYTVGFWSFFAPLFISVRWRRKYFTTIDGLIEYLFHM